MNRKWYAIYTRPRWEKKTNTLLRDRGVYSYCPLYRNKRRWSDRDKWVEVPLFASYVFVHISELEMPLVRAIPGVLNFVYWNGKPAAIKDEEIENIRRFLNTYEAVDVIRIDYSPGDEVTIVAGPLMNRKGKVLSVGKKMVKLRIDSLGYELVAFVDIGKVVK